MKIVIFLIGTGTVFDWLVWFQCLSYHEFHCTVLGLERHILSWNSHETIKYWVWRGSVAGEKDAALRSLDQITSVCGYIKRKSLQRFYRDLTVPSSRFILFTSIWRNRRQVQLFSFLEYVKTVGKVKKQRVHDKNWTSVSTFFTLYFLVILILLLLYIFHRLKTDKELL